MRQRYLLLVAALVFVVPMMASADLPDSMGALGDSITRAALADDSIGGLDYGQPEHSWSTGYESGDACYSHYERILASNSAISGNNNNLAESGARADDLPGQANDAVTAGVEYVTIEMGGNDLCRDSAASMTATATYISYFQTCIDTLQAGLPDATILVCEVPKIRQVYDNRNFWCPLKWAIFQWCDSALRNGSTERALVDARNIEYNNALATLCANEGINFEDGVYEMYFTYSNLSSIDCFHPDVGLNGTFAATSYDASIF